MDSTEKLVKEFLESLGHAAPLYEPDGNVPPDFLVNSSIAIEVRRLNQLISDETGSIVGLEGADIPLWIRMRDFINGLQVTSRSVSTFGVFYSFRRPIPKWKGLQAQLQTGLLSFMSGPRTTPYKSSLPCGVDLRIFDWKLDKGTAFRLAGSSDQQSGGYIVGNLQFAIQFAVTEKEGKVSKFRSRYPEWWLVLVDHVSFGTDEHDRKQLFEGWGVPHTFDKCM